MKKNKKYLVIIVATMFIVLLFGVSYTYNYSRENSKEICYNQKTNQTNKVVVLPLASDEEKEDEEEETECSSLGFFESIFCKITSFGRKCLDRLGQFLYDILRVIFYIF